MNLIMHDVTEFKGFAMAKFREPECRFLNNVLQDAEILGSAGNVTALHSPRMSLEDFSISLGPSPVRLAREEKGDPGAAYDYQECIEEREALSRFEWEGGNAGIGFQ